jgi:hypothetical protein
MKRGTDFFAHPEIFRCFHVLALLKAVNKVMEEAD